MIQGQPLATLFFSPPQSCSEDWRKKSVPPHTQQTAPLPIMTLEYFFLFSLFLLIQARQRRSGRKHHGKVEICHVWIGKWGDFRCGGRADLGDKGWVVRMSTVGTIAIHHYWHRYVIGLDRFSICSFGRGGGKVYKEGTRKALISAYLFCCYSNSFG